MKLNEKKLRKLFKRQETLTPMNEEYYKNREFLMRKLLKEMKGALIAKQIEWQNKYHIDSAEAESLIYESLLTTIDTFKPSKGNCKFTSFFWTVTSQIFKNYLSKIYAQKRTPRFPLKSLNTIEPEQPQFAPTYSLQSMDDEKQWLSLQETIQDEEIPIEKHLHHKFLLEKIYNEATSKEKTVLDHLYKGESYSVVGKFLNLAPSDICNIVKNIRLRYKKLSGEIGGKENYIRCTK